MTSIPQGWVSVKLGDIANIAYGKGLPIKNLKPEGFPVFGANGVIGFFDEYLFEEPQLLISCRGANSGTINFSPSQCFVTNNSLIVDFPVEQAQLRKTLFYFLIAANKERIVTGTAQPQVTINNAVELELCLPPLAEQHRIVAKIEELFSELDQGVASLKTAREQLKVYRQSLLKNAFAGKLTAAVAWHEKSLGQLLGFLTSGSRGWAAYYASSGDLFVRAQNIKHDCLELDDVAFVSLPDKAEGLRTRIQQGDLLITITGANVTKAALVKHELGTAYVSQHVALCRLTKEILPDYLYWFVVAEAAGRKQLTEMAYGAGKPGLNLENIRSVQVPLPSLSEQQEIVELIESKLSEADQLDQTLATALQQAEALRQSILKKAFCGQLVKQDKNDEPASALLERIRAAHSIDQPARRGRSAGRQP